MQPHFRDVTDHVRAPVREDIDALREVLAFAFEASVMNDAVQQTKDYAHSSRPGPPSWRCRRQSPASTA